MDRLNQEWGLLEEAFAALHTATGLRGHVIKMQPRIPDLKYPPDALVEIKEQGEPCRFIAEIKANTDRAATVGHVKAQLDRQKIYFPDYQPLFVTRFITRKMADECRRLDLPFIDTAGNAYLRGPGLFIYVVGQDRPKEPERVDYRANTRAGLKIVFALLCKPDWVAATYREIAERAAVALGAVGPVLKDLEDRGFIRKTKAKGMVLENTRKLFDEWTARYPEVLRPKLERRRYQVDPEHLLHAKLVNAYWGGERAAELLTGYLHPEQFTLYTRGPAQALLRQLRVRLAPEGNTEVLQAFWTPELDQAGEHVVPPMLVYADLVATGIARNVEAARILYERIIEPTLTTD
jgi:hypothetical protein